MKRYSTLAVAVACIAGVVGMGAPAYAGTGDCSRGYACVWADNDYNGKWWAQSISGSVKSTINNMASSAAANGGTCDATRFYDNGAASTGSYFVLNSRTLAGVNYRDPKLSNGAGTGPYSAQNWDNRVSRIVFTGPGC